MKASIRDDVQQGLLEIGAERDVFCSEMKVYYEAVVVEVRLPLDGQQLLDAAPSVGVPNPKPGPGQVTNLSNSVWAPRSSRPPARRRESQISTLERGRERGSRRRQRHLGSAFPESSSTSRAGR